MEDERGPGPGEGRPESVGVYVESHPLCSDPRSTYHRVFPVFTPLVVPPVVVRGTLLPSGGSCTPILIVVVYVRSPPPPVPRLPRQGHLGRKPPQADRDGVVGPPGRG